MYVVMGCNNLTTLFSEDSLDQASLFHMPPLLLINPILPDTLHQRFPWLLSPDVAKEEIDGPTSILPDDRQPVPPPRLS